MLAVNEICKNDKSIINGLLSKFWFCIGILSYFVSWISYIFAIKIIYTDDIYIGVLLIVLLICIYTIMGYWFLIFGTTSFDIKFYDRSRANAKGSICLLETLACIPIRRSSLFRFQFNLWIINTLVFSVITIVLSIITLINPLQNVIIVYEFILIAFILNGCIFFEIFSISFRSHKVIFITNVITVFMTTASTLLTIGISVVMTGECILPSSFLAAVNQIVIPTEPLAYGAIAFVISYIVAFYLIYKKCILNGKAGGWIE